MSFISSENTGTSTNVSELKPDCAPSASSEPKSHMNHECISKLAKSMECYISALQSNGAFQELSVSLAEGTIPSHIPSQNGNQSCQPGPLVAPSFLPIKADLCATDASNKNLMLAQDINTGKHTRPLTVGSDAIGIDYRSMSSKAISDIVHSGHGSTMVKKESDGSSEQPLNATRPNKFVRRLYDMLCNERNSGLVQWRRGLLVLLDTKAFAKQILAKYFNTRNFKTFRRQLNYYGFVHVRSYSNTGTKSTTALWVNKELATGKLIRDIDDEKNMDVDSITSVLQLKRVDGCESVKTSEARRERKELAMSAIEEDLGVSANSIALHQLHTLCDERAKNKLETSKHLFHLPTNILPISSSKINNSNIQPRGEFSSALINQYRLDGENTSNENIDVKPPTSSTSVANLLLLLSSG